ncbi:unnamed protein product [Lactuca virosa]|uniref:Uncharacterized protein n=1 Tax=Lactuca virosa TaxID=75947 RepID=A0AAU9MNC1_9ASTR|nr:unnamed protein product [Lactuca virosa]
MEHFLYASQSCFNGAEDNLGIGNDALSYAEFLHTTRDFETAKKLYENVIKGIPENKDYSDPYNLAVGNMVWEDILLAATCALGQLESHMGNFGDAEEILKRALTVTEERFGSHHPNIGIILTCITLMFRHKATIEHSSSLMVQEFDWEGDLPLSFSQRDLVIYEMHVRGFTSHESSKTESPGTYLGVVDKLDHLKVHAQ